MIRRLAAAWNWLLDWWLEPKCRACGERVPVASFENHWRLDHAGDWIDPRGRAA